MLVDVGDALLGDPMYDLVSCMRKRSECAAHRMRHRAACSTQHTPCNSHERRLRRSDCDRMRSAATGPARQVALHISALHCDVALLREFLQEYGGPWSHCGTFEYAAPPKSC
jgi:hypothetical protein